MKRNTIRKRFAMVIAAVVTMAGVGSVQGSSQGNTSNVTYAIFDYSKNQRIENDDYTLMLPEAYDISTYSLIDEDNRRDYVNSGVVQVTTSEGYGTGFIVGDHTIATAAHCLYVKSDKNSETNHFVTNTKVKLYDNKGNYVETVSAKEAHLPVDYINCIYGESYLYDYALLTVAEDLSDYEHFELGEVLSSAANSTTIPVSVCGYSDGTLQISEGRLKEIRDKHFYYDAFAVYGDSGGPVFVSTIYTVGTEITYLKTVIGIHTYGADPLRQGNLITPEVRQFFLNNEYNTYEE